jgi:Snare region anchored in the vesicle membrane C-terminus
MLNLTKFPLQPQEAANRSRLLQGRAVLERTSDSLGRSLAVAAETERVGTEVVGELHVQRESLEHTRGRVRLLMRFGLVQKFRD